MSIWERARVRTDRRRGVKGRELSLFIFLFPVRMERKSDFPHSTSTSTSTSTTINMPFCPLSHYFSSFRPIKQAFLCHLPTRIACTRSFSDQIENATTFLSIVFSTAAYCCWPLLLARSFSLPLLVHISLANMNCMSASASVWKFICSFVYLFEMYLSFLSASVLLAHSFQRFIYLL